MKGHSQTNSDISRKLLVPARALQMERPHWGVVKERADRCEDTFKIDGRCGWEK